ncbi:MAG: SCO family protein [Sphingobacteriaceae bacterium]|nr:SCO family protein [Sphingobacteriaceae bacterium]
MKLNSLFAACILLLAACSGNTEKRLPILGEREPVEKVVDGKTVTDTIYQTIPAFSFLNQDSVSVTEKDFEGKIFVADFFFTSCTSICPIMHRNMLKVYETFKGNKEVGILSHTIDFKYDTPSRLKSYSEKLGISGNQWQFLKGSKDSVYTLAEKSYLVAVSEDKAAKDGFVHQGWFILVDKDKRLRGAYDGTKPEDVDKLISEMNILLEEYK